MSRTAGKAFFALSPFHSPSQINLKNDLSRRTKANRSDKNGPDKGCKGLNEATGMVLSLRPSFALREAGAATFWFLWPVVLIMR